METKYSDAVCVVLLELTADPSGGYILAPANWDLPCFINESEELTGEINLIDGKQRFSHVTYTRPGVCSQIKA